jgi:hypothetical protein
MYIYTQLISHSNTYMPAYIHKYIILLIYTYIHTNRQSYSYIHICIYTYIHANITHTYMTTYINLKVLITLLRSSVHTYIHIYMVPIGLVTFRPSRQRWCGPRASKYFAAQSFSSLSPYTYTKAQIINYLHTYIHAYIHSQTYISYVTYRHT